MWTANIIEIKKRDTSLNILVEFLKDGVVHSNFFFEGIVLGSLKSLITNRIAQLKNIDDLDTSSLIGAVDLTPPPPPTKAEVDKQNYFNLVFKRNLLEAQIKAGALKPDDSIVADLEGQIKAAFKPEYIS